MPVPAMLCNSPLRYLHVSDELNILCVLRAGDVLLAGEPNCSEMSLPDCPSSSEHHRGLSLVSSAVFYQACKNFASLQPQLQSLDLVAGGLKKSWVEGTAYFSSCPAAVSVFSSVSLTNNVELLGPAPAKHFNKARAVKRALEPSEAQSWLPPSLVLHSL